MVGIPRKSVCPAQGQQQALSSVSTAAAMVACWASLGDDGASFCERSGLEDAVDPVTYFVARTDVDNAAVDGAVDSWRRVTAWPMTRD